MLNVRDNNVENADVLFFKIMSCEINVIKDDFIIFLFCMMI